MKKNTRFWLIFTAAFVVLAAVSLAVCGGNIRQMATVSADFGQISDYAYDGKDNLYIVDTYRSRLLQMNAAGQLIRTIYVGGDESIISVAAGSNRAYYVVRGGEGDTLVTLLGDGKQTRELLKESFHSLVGYGDMVGIVFWEEGMYRMEVFGRGKGFYTVAPDAQPWRMSLSPGGTLYMLDYNGDVWEMNGEQNTLILSAQSQQFGERYIPGGIATGSGERLWVANLESRTIGRITYEGGYEAVLSAEELITRGFARVDNSGFYSVKWQKELMGVIGSRVVLLSDEGHVRSWDQAAYSPLALVLRGVFWLSIAVLILPLGKGILWAVGKLRSLRLTPLTGQAIQFTLFVVIFCCCVGVNLLGSYQRQFSLSRESWLRQTALLGAVKIMQNELLDVAAMQEPGAQKLLHESLLRIAQSAKAPVEASIVIPSGDAVRVLAQTREQVPLYYPLEADIRSQTDDGFSYLAAMSDSTMSYDVVVDAYGRWETCLCPIPGADGKVAALLEMRVDADAFAQENSAFLTEAILSTASIVVVLLFFLIEVNRLMAVTMDPLQAGEVPAQRRRLLIRWLGFIAFTAINIPMFFIPLQAGSLYDAAPVGFLSRQMATALPLTGNMLAMAVSSTVCAGWVEKKGWKSGALAGTALCALGYALAMVFGHVLWYIGMMFLSGLGIGLLALSLQTCIFATAPENDDKSDHLLSLLNSGMFAGANCGVIFGSLLADQMGYFAAFMVAVGIFVFAALCIMRMLPNAALAGGEEETGGMSALRFLANGKVLIFLVLMLVPLTVLGFFVAHFLPLFADENGISATIASWGYLLNGVVIIYIGPVLTRTLIARMGSRKAVLLTAAVALAGIGLFAAVPTIPAAFVTSALLGFSDAGGQVSRQEEFLRLPQSRRAGASRALSTFSLFENIGQTIGPGVFSLILAVGIRPGMLALTVVTAACLALYAVTGGMGKSARPSAGQSIGM